MIHGIDRLITGKEIYIFIVRRTLLHFAKSHGQTDISGGFHEICHHFVKFRIERIGLLKQHIETDNPCSGRFQNVGGVTIIVPGDWPAAQIVHILRPDKDKHYFIGQLTVSANLELQISKCGFNPLVVGKGQGGKKNKNQADYNR